MINSSVAFKEAVVADVRRTLPRVVADIRDPDLVYGAVTSSGETALSDGTELYDKATDLTEPYATLELNRWLLNEGFSINTASDEIGVESSGLFGSDATGSEWVQLAFSGVDILQNCSVYFSSRICDGWPVDFTVEIMNSGVAMYTETVTDNTARFIKIGGFTVYNPDAIRVTVTKWSLPEMRMRTAEIIVGVYEIWGGDDLTGLDIVMQTTFNLLTLPYSTCKLGLNNIDRRFDPRNKAGLFQSIEDRQPLAIFVGVETPNGPEYIPCGIYYQFDGGWKTGANATTMNWILVDIIGLLQTRRFNPPGTYPTTLEGWVSELVGQLGPVFAGHYSIAAGYESLSLTAASGSMSDVSCGQLLLWLCQAALLFPRSDPETGYLSLEEYWDNGNSLELDNLTQYPGMAANGDIADIVFTFPDNTTYTVVGTSSSSSTSASIQNPFIKNSTSAIATARYIISTFGGNRIECIGRGDPTSELGDVETVQLDSSSATTGRLMYHRLHFVSGVLQGCSSKLLQASGIGNYEERVQITASGTWTVPEGVTTIRILLVGHGSRGEQGEDGEPAPPPDDTESTKIIITKGERGGRGADGLGGKVWAGTLSTSPGTTYTITIGDDTTFGIYSSANGIRYANGFTDLNSGESFARPGVEDPEAGSGDGGRGGAGGAGGISFWRKGILVWDQLPEAGETGTFGATGSAVIYYDKPE